MNFFEQLPDIECLIVPVGGGGLLSGVLLAAEDKAANLSVVGCQSERFASFYTSYYEGHIQRQVYRHTLADGLMVNLDANAITLSFSRSRVNRLVLLTEEELAAGVYTLLQRESLLVEASGAAGVAAVLANKLENLPGIGPIGILLTGGNISSESLAYVMTFPYTTVDLRRQLDLEGRNPTDEAYCIGISKKALRSDQIVMTNSYHLKFQQKRLSALRQQLHQIDRQHNDFRNFCRQEGLEVVISEQQLIDIIRHELNNVLKEYEETKGAHVQPPTAQWYHRVERIERLAHQTLAFLNTIIGWQSPSYLQTKNVNFSKLSSQHSSRVNYTRYGSTTVSESEDQFLEVLGFDPSNISLLLTSSGMAAYTLVESFLIRNVLNTGETILIPPYLYFEATEQLTSLPYIRIIRTPDTRIKTILEAVQRYKPRVIFLDPLTNTADLRLVNVPRLLSELKELIDYTCWVVIDGTMLSGALNPFESFPVESHVQVLYYESGSKYLQLGLDLTLIGLVASSIKLRPMLERARRNTGTILYEQNAALLPIFDREWYLYRMRQMTQNAISIGEYLLQERNLQVRDLVKVNFPGLPHHPDYSASKIYPHLGGLMTFVFTNPGLNHRDMLNAFIERAISYANKQDIALTKGVSFGFSTPRLSAAAAMAETSPPFLRLSVGDQETSETERLASILADAFISFIDNFDLRHRRDDKHIH